MKKKPKGLIPTLITGIVICLLCGTIGLLNKNKGDDPKDKEKPIEYKAAYRYYLDGEEVEELITQEYTEMPNPEFEGATMQVENYSFEKYTCTNNVTGEWDEINWEFKPTLTANTTCRLYFLRNMHNVTFKANNGTLPNGTAEETKLAMLNEDTTINIIPKDGYTYDKVECTNEIGTNYNTETNDLTISNVKKDSICTISYKIRAYQVETKASNGTVTEDAKTVNYGENATFIVTPAENYRFDTVTCTNNQKATYSESDGKLTITGITNDTVCSISFKPIKFNVTLNITNGTLVNTSTTQSVSEGRNVTFAISANDGYAITDAIKTCNPQAQIEVTGSGDGGGIVSIFNITSDLTCNVELKAAN